jgi:hypothetical protein
MSKKNKEVVNKSHVKIAGLKSTFVNKDFVNLTTFDRGEKALLEKTIHQKNIPFEKIPPAFNVTIEPDSLLIKGINNETGRIPIVSETSISKRAKKKQRKIELAQQQGHSIIKKSQGEDQIRAKSDFEMLFYGRTFKDNIHIQIIYNILDIQKILSPHINHVIFALNNLIRLPSEEVSDYKLEDYVGNITQTNYEKLINNPKNFEYFQQYYNKAKAHFPYFGEAFKGIAVKSNKENKEESVKYMSEEDMYTLLQGLSLIRNSLFHYKAEDKDSIFKNTMYHPQLQSLIDSLYRSQITAVNKSFFDLNTKSNFYILFKLYDFASPHDNQALNLAKKFYEYVVRKDQLNIGLSIRRLREAMIMLPSSIAIKSKDYDTIRSKLYNFLDFIIYHDYFSKPEHIIDIVTSLRKVKNDEDKENVYKASAEKVWQAIENRVTNKLLPLMKPANIRKLPKYNLNQQYFNQILISDNAKSFTKLVYMFSTFLDGKESNELLSGLINKFLEIGSMLNLLKTYPDIGEQNGKLQESFVIFEEAETLATELMLVKAIVHKSFDPVFSNETLLDSCRLLGFKNIPQGESEENYMFQMFDKHKNNNFKNFILNNVTKSRRFQYVVRYVNPTRAKKIIEHKPTILFVLKRLPPEQLDRYVKGTLDKDPSLITQQEKLNILSGALADISFEKFANVVQGRPKNRKDLPNPTYSEKIYKERMKGLIGLYLTVLYIFYKGLINVNSRYTIAFYVYERDYNILTNSKPIIENSGHFSLINNLIQQERYKTVVKTYLLSNMDNFSSSIFKIYRDYVTHLKVIMSVHQNLNKLQKVPNSYFEIYHTNMQLLLLEDITKRNISVSQFISEKLHTVIQHGVYSKDFLQVINVPFAYNFPRYKNLSIEVLFDKNEQLDQAKK